jgi:hypothetical protein
MNKTQFLKELKKPNPLEITFEKSDGTERVMLCSLFPDYLPKTEKNSTKTTKKKPSSDIIVVFDLEKSSWRSFKVKSVTNTEVILTAVSISE